MTVSQAASNPPSEISLVTLAQNTRNAARQLGTQPSEVKNQAIAAIATALEANTAEILAANAADCEAAKLAGIAPALYTRLKLDEAKLKGAIAGVRDVGR